MAFDIAEIQKQVELAVNHDGLSTYIITWTNRTLQDIGTRVHWRAQGQVLATLFTDASETVGNNAIGSNLSLWDVIAPHRVDHVLGTVTNATYFQTATPYRVLSRIGFKDLYGLYEGVSIPAKTGGPKVYALGWFSSTSTGGNHYMHPNIFLHESPANTTPTSGGFLSIHWLTAPFKAAAANYTHWIMDKYFDVVLHGVLRYARLYLGDPTGYLVEKGYYENGVQRMIRAEETVEASMPSRRGIEPESISKF